MTLENTICILCTKRIKNLNEHMAHSVIKKCPSKSRKTFLKINSFRDAPAAFKVQGGLALGEIEEGKRGGNQNFFLTPYGEHKRFFGMAAARQVRPPRAAASTSAAVASTATTKRLIGGSTWPCHPLPGGGRTQKFLAHFCKLLFW